MKVYQTLPSVAFRDRSVKVTILKFYLQDGRTALHWAAEYGYTEVIKTLVQHAADITVKDEVRVKH